MSILLTGVASESALSPSSEGLLVSAPFVTGPLGLRGWHGCLLSEEKASFHSSHA